MQVASDWFREWFDSPYYHQLYFERDEKEAEAFISHLLDHLKPAPNARMLDVACGRGRHARILAARGFDTTGIDLAPSSIAWAMAYEQTNLHFYRHDIRLPFWIHYFDYAFNFFTSFGYFRTHREHAGAVRTVAQSLKSRGIFVLDYLNVNYAEDRLIPQSTKEIDGVLYHLTKWSNETHFYKNIRIEDTGLPAPLTFTEKIAKFKLSDFSELFSLEHLQIREVFGDYALGRYDAAASPRLILIAQKTR